MSHTPAISASTDAQNPTGKPPVSDAALSIQDLEFSVGRLTPTAAPVVSNAEVLITISQMVDPIEMAGEKDGISSQDGNTNPACGIATNVVNSNTASTTAQLSLEDCNCLLWNTTLTDQLKRLKRAGCNVSFKRDKTPNPSANGQVIYLYLQDQFAGSSLDMVYAPRTLTYLDLATATPVLVAEYILQFAEDLKPILDLWKARLDYSAHNLHKDMPHFEHLLDISVADIGDVPSVWGRGDSIPAYNLHFEYYSESGLHDLFCALSRSLD